MQTWETGAAIGALGVLGFQLYDMWDKAAPSLEECRQALPGDFVVGQKLRDANVTVGSLALVIGLLIAALSRSITPLLVILIVFGAVSFWHHDVYRGTPVANN